MDYETPPDDQHPKRGKARERYEKRKQQRDRDHARPASMPRQIKPPQQFSLPRITIPRGSRVLIGAAAAVVFVVALVFVLGRVRNNEPEVQPNALWLGTEWTYEEPGDAEVSALAARLRTQEIGTIYAWVSWLQPDKTWRGTDNFENVKTFVNQLRVAYPEADLYGWVGLPTENEDGTTRIGDAILQQQVADFSKRVIDEFGFDGVFLNAEPVWNGDENFLALLRTVRSTVGIDVPISAAIPPDWSPSNSNIPLPPLIEPGTEWTKEYKQSVALLVDHMAVMVYNSGLSSPADYSTWVAYQVKTFAEAVAELNTDTDLIIGIPTYSAAPPGHDPVVENVLSAVEGIKLGIEQAGDAARYVRGLAIYAEWETDESEWTDFQSAWVETN
jgi:hypothetical protein